MSAEPESPSPPPVPTAKELEALAYIEAQIETYILAPIQNMITALMRRTP
jgi:hypothetical protein